ncbi:cytochrome c [Pseudomonas sp. C27(2019)]|uniref:c-type cytochrome n=1 Tax=Pseudomonas sp. C27(2019) TaxID=2604941 RepID=UPI00124804BB|nr:cytochrome c [Pseudomonas sp. C27(2019)]QEY57925.1 cytochrome c [Pseudomonas sp. C27(2019)]
MKKLMIGSLAALFLTASFSASAQIDPEDQIHFRKAGYAFMSWNMEKIKAMAIDESIAWDPAQVQAAANSIAATANSGMGALYGPGTEKNIGDTKTAVKPEMFTDGEGVVKVGVAFNKAANELAEAAATGDKALVAKAFAAAGDGCKGCHDKYRMD